MLKNYKPSIFVNHTDLYNPAFQTFSRRIKSLGKYNKINIYYGKYQKIKKNNRKSFLPYFDWFPHPIALAIKLAGLPKKITIVKNKVFLKKT